MTFWQNTQIFPNFAVSVQMPAGTAEPPVNIPSAWVTAQHTAVPAEHLKIILQTLEAFHKRETDEVAKLTLDGAIRLLKPYIQEP
jgi:hypothetical protein